jgi:hypothetical protein
MVEDRRVVPALLFGSPRAVLYLRGAVEPYAHCPRNPFTRLRACPRFGMDLRAVDEVGGC